MVYTLNIKGKANPKDPQMVKLELIFFKTDYPRISKVIDVTGPLKDWDQATQLFKTNRSSSIAKNKILLDLKSSYQAVAESWEYERRVWSPKEWAHCFDEEKSRQNQVKSLSLSQMIDYLTDKFTKKERYKNGRIITSISNAQKYKEIKNSLSAFTQSQYCQSLSSFYFKDIGEQFLLDYMMYIRKRGIENGNKGGLTSKLRLLRAICRHAEKMGIYGVDMTAFDCLGDNLKWPETTSKAVSYQTIRRLEYIDRSLFSEKEQLYLDLFLFSYYAGGMADVDVCNLTTECIKEDKIIYERTKFPKQAKPMLIDRAQAIIDKYRGQGMENYVFPLYTPKQKTDLQRMRRVSKIAEEVSRTLDKACRILGIDEKMTWYSARGSFITRMVDAGYNPYKVAEMAGNSPMVIFKHYYKVTEEVAIRNDMNRMFR